MERHFFLHLLLGEKDVSVESTGDFRPCAMHNSFFYETSQFPLKLRIPGSWDGMSEMKNTNKNDYNTFKMWYLHKQIF